MLDKNVRVKEIRPLGARNYLLTFHSPEQARLTRSGQFLMVKCAEDVEANPLLRRPFSVFDIRRHARSEEPFAMDILVKDVGRGTHRLAQLKPGDRVHALGPQGIPFRIPEEMRDRRHRACLVAGGVGIAALLLLARDLISNRVTPILFYGGRTKADLVLREHFERLRIEKSYTTEDGSLGERGFVTEALEHFMKRRSREKIRIYACGPWGMMKASHEIAARYGIPCEVSLEARMGCSLGACMGCVVHAWDQRGEDQYLRVCLEGPVMPSGIVDWNTPPL